MATGNRAGFWNDSVWASIDDGVSTSVNATRVTQKVIQSVQLDGTTSVPADPFNADEMSIEEGITKPYVELAIEFPLTNGQVNDDSNGITALNLAKLAAKSLALAEDMILLQGKDKPLPANVRIESGKESLKKGILGSSAGQPIAVGAPDPHAPTNSGGEILAAITNGIARLTGKVQTPPFALIAGTDAFAEIWGSVINGAPAYTVLNPVLTGGIYGTGAMPGDAALLIALGGDPTTIYVGSDAVTEPTYKDRQGKYFFRIFERIQYVARDKRAFVRLNFPHLRAPAGRGREVRADRGQRADPVVHVLALITERLEDLSARVLAMAGQPIAGGNGQENERPNAQAPAANPAPPERN